jgi:acyl-CoA reductase-like NAD-dependent aldehyde dehydrogenase
MGSPMDINYDTSSFSGTGDQQMIIDGVRVNAVSQEVVDIHDPSTGQKIGTSPAASHVDIDLAVAAARRTFDSGVWRSKSATERQNILLKAADILEKNASVIIRLEALNSGMLLPLAEATIANSVQAARFYAGMATKIYGQTAEISGGHGQFHAYTLKEPVGVAALIVPWNVPVYLTMVKLSAALAAGCSCIIKPSEETPFTALMLADFFHQAGVPDGVINVVTGYGSSAGAALAEHPDVDKVAFTGSGETGKRIIRASADNLKKLTLELGGKSPVIMFDDCDISKVTQGIAAGIFTHSGQICVAGSRLYVQRSIFDQTVDGLSKIASSLKIGHCFDKDTQIGPLISEKQRNRVEAFMGSGMSGGGEVITGGAVVEGDGYFFEPTIIANPSKGSPVVKEEIFGPVLCAIPFDDIEEVILEANNTDYGLASSIWTNDLNRAHYLSKKIQSGMVWVNCHMASDVALPGGGYKQSGWGREQGLEGLDAYLQTKTVCMALSAP